MRKTDKKDLVFVYSSKEPFGRALQEDLSYFPAQVQLGYPALESKDTTRALSEMDLAVQIRGDDPMLRFVYGYSLAVSGKSRDSDLRRKAVEERVRVLASKSNE
jgi:hypothetical protein